MAEDAAITARYLMPARILIGWAVLCLPPLAASADEPNEKPFKPVLVIHGSHSAIRQDKFDVCTTTAEWEAVWEKHRGENGDPRFTETRQALDIDFDTHYVVSIFTRDKAECLVTTFTRGDAVLVRYDAHPLQIAGRIGVDVRTKHEKAKADSVAAYTFVVLPKPAKTVVIEQGLRADLTQPFTWEERKRFPAPKDNK